MGLREGLEAGLVVTILIGAVRKLAPGRSLTPVWLGVASAAVTSLSFGAVLTFTRAEISPRAQEIFGGVTSLVAVALVTTMIFWMRRAARGMAGELRARVGDALLAGGAALVVTAFVAVAREGLEAALFVWTNAQAAGSSTSPLIGALIGLLIAIALCVGLYRRVLKIDLARFFRITGAVLIVIVAGVLAYGVRDLQDANVLPGNRQPRLRRQPARPDRQLVDRARPRSDEPRQPDVVAAGDRLRRIPGRGLGALPRRRACRVAARRHRCANPCRVATQPALAGGSRRV